MDYLKTDEEQGEALKRWLAQNGLGLVVAIGVGVGWSWVISSGSSTKLISDRMLLVVTKN